MGVPGFTIAASDNRHFGHTCRWFFTVKIEKLLSSVKSMLLDWTSNAAMKHLLIYQKQIGWRFKSFLNWKTNYRMLSMTSIIVSIPVNHIFVLAATSICWHSFAWHVNTTRPNWGNGTSTGLHLGTKQTSIHDFLCYHWVPVSDPVPLIIIYPLCHFFVCFCLLVRSKCTVAPKCSTVAAFIFSQRTGLICELTKNKALKLWRGNND